jgi:HPt (histidine-containing phosphotransfer) domain-containing protein
LYPWSPRTPSVLMWTESSSLALPEGIDDSAATADEATDPLDRGVLQGLRELGDADLLSELVDLFLEDVPPQLEALREAVKSGDASSVERVTHALKGSCANMGAVGMVDICAELEDVGHSGKLGRVPMLVERLRAEFGCVRQALLATMKKGAEVEGFDRRGRRHFPYNAKGIYREARPRNLRVDNGC